MHIYASLSKVEEQDDGTLLVSGIASTEDKDSAGEVVTAAAMKAALPGYLQFPAIREMHGLSAAGTAMEASVGDDGVTRIVAKVVDPVAITKVTSGTYRGFSIGGKVQGRDPKNRTIITKIDLREISLVDRPCNPEAKFDMWKADGASTQQDPDMDENAGAPAPEDASAAPVSPEVVEAAAPVEKVADAAPEPAPVVEAVTTESEPTEPVEAVAKGEPATEAAEPVIAGPAATDRAEAAVSALEAAIAKVTAPGDLGKGMYSVSRFADVLSSLAYLVMDCEYEAEIEADGSPVPAALRAGLTSLLATFKDMAAEEADELMSIGKTKKAAESEAVTKAAEADTLSKVATEADELRKAVADRDATIVKFAERVEPLVKTVSDLSERLAKIEAEPAPPKTAGSTLAKAVGKEEDAAGHPAAVPASAAIELNTDNVAKVLAGMSDDERGMVLMKAALARPVPVTR